MKTTKIKRDYLPGTEIYLKQDSDMFRINTDTALLGQFFRVQPKETFLDLGCNNGALMLYASQYKPVFMFGVDIQPKACELAIENLKVNKVEDFEIYCDDIHTFQHERVDVIAANPPYFNTPDEMSRNDNESLAIARHEIYCPLEALAACVGRCLKTKGRFYLVHRASRFGEIIEVMAKENLRPVRSKLVYDQNKEWAGSILIEFSFSSGCDLHWEKPELISR